MELLPAPFSSLRAHHFLSQPAFRPRHGRLQEPVMALVQAPPVPLLLQESRSTTHGHSPRHSTRPPGREPRTQQPHSPPPSQRNEPNTVSGTKLITMHSRAGRLRDARKVFDGMVTRDLLAWSAIIGAYAMRGLYHEVIALAVQMFGEGVIPDKFLITRVFQACAYTENLGLGMALHSMAIRRGFIQRLKDVAVGNSVLVMYVKCGELGRALMLFEMMEQRDMFTWNSMIHGFCLSGELEEARKLLDDMRRGGTEPGIVTWNTLIPSYARSGDLDVAMELLEEMEESGVAPDVVIWTSLVSAFVNSDRGDEALQCFHQMCLAGVEPNDMTIASAILACASLKLLNQGMELHGHAIKIGSVNHVLSGNSLVVMYAKCGEIAAARRIFNAIPEKDIFSWNSIISGYAQAGYCDEAYELFCEMENHGVQRNAVTWNIMISGYILNGNDEIAFELFQIMEKYGVKSDTASWIQEPRTHQLHGPPSMRKDSKIASETKLITMHSYIGRLGDARKLFDGMVTKDLLAWSAIIGAYAIRGMYHEVIALAVRMVGEGVIPDRILITRVFQACAYVENLGLGMLLHSMAIRRGFTRRVRDVAVGNSVLMMYVKCGDLECARMQFEMMERRDLCTWNSMIFGFCLSGEWEEARKLLKDMRHGGTEPGVVTWNTLISSYARSGDLDVAMELLEEMEESRVAPDVVTWTSLVSGFVRNDRGDEALQCFHHMRLAGVEPNGMTIASAISACASLKLLNQGMELHCHAIKVGSVNNVLSGNSLVDMYAKCGDIVAARRIFDEIPEKDIFSWNSIISGYAHAGYCGKAYELFCKMESHGVRRNTITWNIMISGYIQNGDDERAFELFQIMENYGVKRDTASWNNLISGSMQNGHFDRALRIFRQMQSLLIKPDYITILSIIPAFANLVTFWKVREVHACIFRHNLEMDDKIANALINAYSKSGDLAGACAVFYCHSSRNICSWNCIIRAHLLHGSTDEALVHFGQMKQASVLPDHTTLAAVIKAYGIKGNISKGKELFFSMTHDYNIIPDLDHYAAMVDLLGRSGRLQEAYELIDEMPLIPNSAVWEAFLTAATANGNLRLAYVAARELAAIDPRNPRIHRLQDLAGKSIDAPDMMVPNKGRELDEVDSCSIEINNKVYWFSTGDNFDLEHTVHGLKLIQMGLSMLNTDNGSPEERGEVTGIHCEKVAIAFGISNSPPFRCIRIIKTLRMCSHCHTFAKLVSEKYKRQIMIKDANCLHKFVGGKCSCEDYW